MIIYPFWGVPLTGVPLRVGVPASVIPSLSRELLRANRLGLVIAGKERLPAPEPLPSAPPTSDSGRLFSVIPWPGDSSLRSE